METLIQVFGKITSFASTVGLAVAVSFPPEVLPSFFPEGLPSFSVVINLHGCHWAIRSFNDCCPFSSEIMF